MSALSPVTTSTGKTLPIDPTVITPTLLANEALENPGFLHACYRTFSGHSANNRFSIYWQCKVRGLEPGPVASYAEWQALDRQVRRGEKKLMTLHPMFREREVNGKKERVLVGFQWQPSVFVISQTDGEPLDVAAKIPFDITVACETLGIKLEPFESMDGNCQGYAKPGRVVSVNPIGAHPMRTLFHEIGHTILGHTEKSVVADYDEFSYSTNDVEAELFSYCVAGMLDIEDNEEERGASRGYIRYWMENAPASEWSDRNIRRVFSAVDRFLALTKKGDSTTVAA